MISMRLVLLNWFTSLALGAQAMCCLTVAGQPTCFTEYQGLSLNATFCTDIGGSHYASNCSSFCFVSQERCCLAGLCHSLNSYGCGLFSGTYTTFCNVATCQQTAGGGPNGSSALTATLPTTATIPSTSTVPSPGNANSSLLPSTTIQSPTPTLSTLTQESLFTPSRDTPSQTSALQTTPTPFTSRQSFTPPSSKTTSAASNTVPSPTSASSLAIGGCCVASTCQAQNASHCLAQANATYAGDGNTNCIGFCERTVTLFDTYVWSLSQGPVTVNGTAHFSGSLTLVLNPDTLGEGQTLTLFQYASFSGQFDEILIDASGCLIEVQLFYGAFAATLAIQSIDCASRTTSFSLASVPLGL